MTARLYSEDISFRLAACASLLLAVALYLWLAWLASGGDVWWHVDVVGRMVTFWGDDAYRFYEARSGFAHLDDLWFSFILPLARFLDGVVVSLVQGDLLYSRFVKALLVVGGSTLVFRACRSLSVDRTAAFAAVALLALHPLYIFVGMSFYGESWLALLVILALFLHLRDASVATLVVVSLMPLVRPEGIFFVFSFGAWHAWHRRWRLAVIPFIPGFLYFLSILMGPGLKGFLEWRFVINDVYQTSTDWIGEGGQRILRTFFIPWVIVSVWGLALPAARRIAVISIPVVVIMLFFPATTFLAEKASFEPRYLMPTLPVLALGFAIAAYRGKVYLDRRFAGGWSVLGIVLMGMLCLQSQLRASVAIERAVNHYLAHGELPADIQREPLDPGSWIHGISSWGLAKNREAADVIARMTQSNRDIKLLLIGNIEIFYHLEPERIRDGVGVVFVPVPAQKLISALGGIRAAGYFSFAPYGGYVRLRAAEPGTAQVLLVDELDLPTYPLHWQVGQNDIFLFSGGLEPAPGAGQGG